jgi:hypothetical protein
MMTTRRTPMTETQAIAYLDQNRARLEAALSCGDREAVIAAMRQLTDDGWPEAERAVWDTLLGGWEQLRDTRLMRVLTKDPHEAVEA